MHINAQIISCVLLNVSLLYSIICVCLGVVVALRIQVVVLDEAIIVVYRFGQGTSTVRRALSRTSSSCLFRDSIAGIDPVGIHVDGRR
jgi:DNA-binding transcriptional regulator PaaX